MTIETAWSWAGRRILTIVVTLTACLACFVVTSFGQSADEAAMARLVEVLELAPGMSIADVGAGQGEWTLRLAARAGDSGHVFATEVDATRVATLLDKVGDAGLSNVTVIQGGQDDTRLPAACCDAILLRLVYHHFTDPSAMQASLFRSLRPGGRIAVVDFEPRGSSPPRGVPENRNGHGVARGVVAEEMMAAGFELLETLEQWDGRADRYCVVFRRPLSGSPG